MDTHTTLVSLFSLLKDGRTDGILIFFPLFSLPVCLQQQKIAELLSLTEREGKGYVPQCGTDGLGRFEPRQCSRNGLVCWCVDPLTGAKVKGSMGSAEEVFCDAPMTARSLTDGQACAPSLCGVTCDYGFKADENGCALCACDDPCEQLACPSGEECIMATEPGCKSSTCARHPECRRIFVPPCAFGDHLTNEATGEPVGCTASESSVSSKFACPSGYHCTFSLPNNASYCCPAPVKDTQARTPEEDGRLPSICEMMKQVADGKRTPEAGYQVVIKNPRCTHQVKL